MENAKEPNNKPNFKPYRVTVNLPRELEQIFKARVRELKYPSESAFLVGLVLFDLLSKRDHRLTGSLMREPQWSRDQFIAEVVKTYELDPGPKDDGWFDRTVKEIIAERMKLPPANPDAGEQKT